MLLKNCCCLQPQGHARGGAVYIRWGRDTCPEVEGTETVYSGRAGGNKYNFRGAGANHLCMPDDPEYAEYGTGIQGYSTIYGVEYRPNSAQPLFSLRGHNVPCSVCYTEHRGAVQMIPAKLECPSHWTEEYKGYLMCSNNFHFRSTYECVDIEPGSVPGLDAEAVYNAFLYHVEPTGSGLASPPYDEGKELTCIVCSR